MKRTFIAIDIPQSTAIKNCLDILSEKLANERIKWLKEDNLHLTLKFLGDTDEKLIKSIGSKLLELAGQQLQFSCTVKNVGVFRNNANPSIIWVGIDTCEQLTLLKNLIESNLTDFGFPAESRRFSPHLTIGRVKFLKDKNLLIQVIQEFQDKVFQQFVVSELIFYESILSYKGPQYIALEKFGLKQP